MIFAFGVEILTDVKIVAVSATVIALGFTMPVPYALDVLIDTLTGALADACADELAKVNVNVLAAVVSTLKFGMPIPLGESSCCTVFECWSKGILARAHGLHARMPWDHVCLMFASRALPQFPNQEPPRAQQLLLPDFLMVPHSEHTETMVAVVSAGVYMLTLIVKAPGQTRHCSA